MKVKPEELVQPRSHLALNLDVNVNLDRDLVNVKSSMKLLNVAKEDLISMSQHHAESLGLHLTQKLNFFVVKCSKGSSLTFTLFHGKVNPLECHVNMTGHRDLALDRHSRRLLQFLHQHPAGAGPRPDPPGGHGLPQFVLGSHRIDSLTSRIKLASEINLFTVFHTVSTRIDELKASFNPSSFAGLVLKHKDLKTVVLHRRCGLFFGQKREEDLRDFLRLLKYKWKLI